MNNIEFGKKCQPLNKKYYGLFKYIPTPSDYIATRDEYLVALQSAVDNEVEISTILKRIEEVDDNESKY